MNAEEFKKLEFLERLKVQTISLEIETTRSLLEHAEALKEENLFYSAFKAAISSNRTSNEKNIYTTYFNEVNARAYTKQIGQSIGGKKSKRTAAKNKQQKDEINMNL